jgi:uncharacterized membrane protein
MGMFKWFRAKIRSYFLAGLLVIVPLGVTVVVITAILRLIDGLLVIIPPQFHPHTYLPKIPGLGLVLAVVLVMITGILVKNYIGHRVVALGEYILSGIPLVRPVYAAVKQVVQAMFGDTAYAFQRAILVEYPRKGVWAIAFVTGKTYDGIQDKIDKKMINVFLPTTPNPTSGFYLVIPEEDTIQLDMNVEDAFKLLISSPVPLWQETAQCEKCRKCQASRTAGSRCDLFDPFDKLRGGRLRAIRRGTVRTRW